jgi:CPA2 family monovalent cation:H+ antiporter-2
MHPELSLLTNVVIALVMAFAGGLIARGLGLPSIVGYLAAGVAIGPFTPGFVGNQGEIAQLAELGVIFLMFGVGLHFSLRDLWAVRSIAIPGAVLQTGIVTLLGLALTQLWGWSVGAGLVLGFSAAIASTVVLLRGLADQGLLKSFPGQVAVGWLVLEDLATVLILVLLPALFGPAGDAPWRTAGIALAKAALFVAVMLFAGARLLPWMLTRIAFTRSRELFTLAVVAIAVGVAFGSAELFGVSLALGAFLAGVVLSGSSISHQVGADLVPFRDIFAVLFFVSVGMLVNPAYLLENASHVLLLTALVVGGKWLIALLIGAVLPSDGRTMLVVAAGLSQIGEFSFLLGQAGMQLGLLTTDQYSLILAGAFISIVINPALFRFLPHTERALRKLPRLWALLDDRHAALRPVATEIVDHVVLIGYGRVGEHVGLVLERLSIPLLVIEIDVKRALSLEERGIPALFGDAANSEVLAHAHLERARILVVTLPDEASTEMVVAHARRVAPELRIVARAATREGLDRLRQMGAQEVIHPELEGGLELLRFTLRSLDYPAIPVEQYTDAVRRGVYEGTLPSAAEYEELGALIDSVAGMHIIWRRVEPQSPLAGRTLGEASLRARSGVSVIALIRERQVLANPGPSMLLQPGDSVGLLGEAEQVAAAEPLFQATPPAPARTSA